MQAAHQREARPLAGRRKTGKLPPMSIILRILLSIALLVMAPTVVLAEQDEKREYRVEVLLLRHLNNEARSFEAPTQPPVPGYSDIGDGELQEQEERIRVRWRGVPWAELSLKSENTRLRRSRDFRPLLHMAWTQAALEPAEAGWVPVRGQAQDGTRLDGSAKLAVSRYLHIKLELTAEIPDKGEFMLDQSRRMKSGEIHYFDHPEFGALVRVIPEPPPEPEAEAPSQANGE